METVVVRISAEAEKAALRFGKSVSQGILQMEAKVNSQTGMGTLNPVDLKAIETVVQKVIERMR